MQKPNKRLAGQTCIVTGANSGIGEAVATAIGKDGANVVINYISNAEVAEDIAHKISMHNLNRLKKFKFKICATGYLGFCNIRP